MCAGNFLITDISKVNLSSLHWSKIRNYIIEIELPDKIIFKRKNKADNLSSLRFYQSKHWKGGL